MRRIVNYFRSAYLCYFSQPATQRWLLRAIRKHRCRRIVELGMGTGVRACLMVEQARLAARQPPHYTGVDLFESRPASTCAGLSLREAHRRLKATGAHVKFIPGDPLAALSRAANDLVGTDLLVISADQDAQSLEAAWYYVPRLLHDRSLVVIEAAGEATGQTILRPLDRAEIDRLATAAASRRRAA